LRHSRARQAETILRVAADGVGRPTLLIGDLNEWRMGKRSSLTFLSPIFDPSHATVASFPSRFPLFPLDRVLGNPHHLVTSVSVHDTPLARVASDHLPVKASIDLKAALKEGGTDDRSGLIDLEPA
jgi:endonuclease/exonuclease/phosphatase family metal-dependent hydrolase